MYEYTGRGFKVEINLEPGIYVLSNMTSTGKTLLCNLLKDFNAYGEPVNGYTYNDYLSKRHINIYAKQGIKVLMLDRYDMYNGVYKEIIKSLANDTIVIVDCKNYMDIDYDYDLCDIRFDHRYIKVEA